MARQTMSLEDKIKSAVDKELTDTMVGFIGWLKEVTGLKIDENSVKVAQRLYAEYVKLPDVAAKIAERKEASKAARAEASAASDKKVLERLSKLDPEVLKAQLAALGLQVTEAE